MVTFICFFSICLKFKIEFWTRVKEKLIDFDERFSFFFFFLYIYRWNDYTPPPRPRSSSSSSIESMCGLFMFLYIGRLSGSGVMPTTAIKVFEFYCSNDRVVYDDDDDICVCVCAGVFRFHWFQYIYHDEFQIEKFFFVFSRSSLIESRQWKMINSFFL